MKNIIGYGMMLSLVVLLAGCATGHGVAKKQSKENASFFLQSVLGGNQERARPGITPDRWYEINYSEKGKNETDVCSVLINYEGDEVPGDDEKDITRYFRFLVDWREVSAIEKGALNTSLVIRGKISSAQLIYKGERSRTESGPSMRLLEIELESQAMRDRVMSAMTVLREQCDERFIRTGF